MLFLETNMSETNMSEMLNWVKTGADGSEMSAQSNSRDASIAAMIKGGWKPAGEEGPQKGKSIDELKSSDPDDLSAPELKELCKALDIEYTGKKEVVARLKEIKAE